VLDGVGPDTGFDGLRPAHYTKLPDSELPERIFVQKTVYMAVIHTKKLSEGY
jgi:hypothetical protein